MTDLKKESKIPCKNCGEYFVPIRGGNGIIKSRLCFTCLNSRKSGNTSFFSGRKAQVKKVSKKQSQKLAENQKTKQGIESVCFICGSPASDLFHLLPKSIYPEYYTKKWNLKMGCREHHNLYDNDLSFRQKQVKIFKHLCKYDEMAARRYFQIYD